MNAFDITVNALRNQGMNSDEILEQLSKLFQGLGQFVCNETAMKNAEEAKIKSLLKELGMPVDIKGYECWVQAIQLYKKKDLNWSLTDMHEQIAKEIDSSPSQVEKAMRYAIEKCSAERVKSMFGYNISAKTGRPKVGQFLAVLAEQIF